jgi:hypothetical protein
MRRPFVIYDFATDPFWISLIQYMRKILFSLFQCMLGGFAGSTNGCQILSYGWLTRIKWNGMDEEGKEEHGEEGKGSVGGSAGDIAIIPSGCIGSEMLLATQPEITTQPCLTPLPPPPPSWKTLHPFRCRFLLSARAVKYLKRKSAHRRSTEEIRVHTRFTIIILSAVIFLNYLNNRSLIDCLCMAICHSLRNTTFLVRGFSPNLDFLQLPNG